MKPILFNKSIEEIEIHLLNKLKERRLNVGIIRVSVKLTIKKYLKKSGIFLRYNKEEHKMFFYYQSKTWSNEEDVILGEIDFDGIHYEEDFIINSVKINMYDPEDIKEFEKIRLRMLFS